MTDRRDPVTGLTDADHEALAEELYAHRADLGGDAVETVIDPAVRSVVSVRFNRESSPPSWRPPTRPVSHCPPSSVTRH